ncbi:MAG: glycosyltransferase [Dehalococcoidia bacterium]|nr:glycosyltransferase [Dehalococcoidia bacterium]
MEILFIVISGLALFTWMLISAHMLNGVRKLRHLTKLGKPQPSDSPLPRVSIIVTARNEEHKAEQALRSLLSLDYPDYEIVYVNDRSDDRTGEIAERLRATDSRIRTIHIQELPPGWFGKNHAAYQAAKAAEGEVLLFTDGDVIFAPDAVAYAVRHLVRDGLDHLALLTRIAVSGPMLRGCIALFGTTVNLLLPPWKVRDPKSSVYFGVGPFNMFLARSYRDIGGHHRVAMRPDEDAQMGKLVKRSGMRSEVVRGEALVDFEWYSTVRGLVRGMEKNFFAAMDYSIVKTVSYTTLMLWLMIVPFILAPTLAIVNGAWPAAIFAAAAAVSLANVALIACQIRHPWWSGLLAPLSALVMIYALWRSAVITIFRGVAWGGPPVPLSELRLHRI